MEQLLDDLRSLLNRQMEEIHRLEEVLDNQRSCLVKRDVEGIIASITVQRECLERVQAMERSRTALMSRIGQQMGLAPGSSSLKQISRAAPSDSGRELERLGEAIHETLDKVGRVNRENRRLIEHSLEFVHRMLGAITGRPVADPVYEASGNLGSRAAERTLIDQCA